MVDVIYFEEAIADHPRTHAIANTQTLSVLKLNAMARYLILIRKILEFKKIIHH